MDYRRIIPAAAFLVIAFYILMGFQDMLYTAHAYTPYYSGSEFWNELNVEPFAAMRWLGCWLTQTAYYPMLATFIYIIMWGAGNFFLDRTLKLPWVWASTTMLPFASLLLGIVGTGYWIYVLKDWGYWFSQSAGLLIMLALLWCFSRFNQKWMIAVETVVCILLYPIIGWCAMLLALCLLILKVKSAKWNVLLLVLSLLSPGWWHIFMYLGVADMTMWLGGFPVFVDAQTYASRPMIPYIGMTALIVILCVFSVFLQNKECAESKKHNIIYGIVTTIVAACSFFFVNLFSFDDYNYQAEMRMCRYAMEDDWQSVIKEARKADCPSRSMVLVKNIALMNTGQLGERSFKLYNDGVEINNPDGIQLNAMQICSPLVYYNYGKLNYSMRWCMEFGVGTGFSPFCLMNMIRAAQGTGETALAEKYLDVLHGHLFYKDWQPKAMSPLVEKLSKAYTNVLDSDNNDLEGYIIKMFSMSYLLNDKDILELALFNSMLYRNPDNFWNAFTRYCIINKDLPLPLHYQEAFLAFKNVWPVELPFEVEIDTAVSQSFNNFLKQYDGLRKRGLDGEALSREMKPAWHGTFFWYMLFGRRLI